MTVPVPSETPLAAMLRPRHAQVVERLAAAFSESGHELALVGGIVRDALLGFQPPVDLDFATDARPEAIMEIGQRAGASSSYDIGARFGTIGLVFQEAELDEPVTVEITTYRSEHYLDQSRHPEVQFGADLIVDLSRRDFTINAMAVNVLSGELVDPFDGQPDLYQGIIRAVGDPVLRFGEDPLRLLRAARFVSQLGFMIEAETLDAMIDAAPSIERISRERVYAELTRLMTGTYASHALETLVQTGLLTLTMPLLEPLSLETGDRGPVHREKDLWEHTKKVVDKAPQRPVIRWAALMHDAAKPMTRGYDASGEIHFIGHEREGALLARKVLEGIHADKTTIKAVSRIVELHGRPGTYERDWTDSAVRRLMLDAGDELRDLLDLAEVDVTSARAFRQQAAAQRIAGLRAHIARLEQERELDQWKSPLDGDELMAAFDRKPGRWIAEIKDRLREMVLDGELEPGDKIRAMEIAREMLAGQ
ncbi:MAG: CCA tRNA nucleotidyltransferase [Thermomicrobiales bacterium]|nr:CCA tRNA nucleotidyltransferase [Thermomicrobiales bacterium]